VSEQRPPRRGDVWLADPPPGLVGHEQALRRPMVIVSNTAYNARSSLVIVVPLTTRDRGSPLHVPIQPPEAGVRQASWIVPEQVRAADRRRLVRRWGHVSAMTLEAIEDRLRMLLDL
jgi:mRNA interferase MazF